MRSKIANEALAFVEIARDPLVAVIADMAAVLQRVG
jgi:hypothetical protein